MVSLFSDHFLAYKIFKYIVAEALYFNQLEMYAFFGKIESEKSYLSGKPIWKQPDKGSSSSLPNWISYTMQTVFLNLRATFSPRHSGSWDIRPRARARVSSTEQLQFRIQI